MKFNTFFGADKCVRRFDTSKQATQNMSLHVLQSVSQLVSQPVRQSVRQSISLIWSACFGAHREL